LLKAAQKLWLWIRMGVNLQLAFGLWTYHLIIKINNKKKDNYAYFWTYHGFWTKIKKMAKKENKNKIIKVK